MVALEKALATAVGAEDYSRAAALKRHIEQLRSSRDTALVMSTKEDVPEAVSRKGNAPPLAPRQFGRIDGHYFSNDKDGCQWMFDSSHANMKAAGWSDL